MKAGGLSVKRDETVIENFYLRWEKIYVFKNRFVEIMAIENEVGQG